jgi:VCBS repeat-containing protein
LELLEGRCVPNAGPALSIDSVAHTDALNGQTEFVFTVSLSTQSPHPVSVNYTSADGTATVAEQDYAPTQGTLTFSPGETAKQITIQVNGNAAAEPDETFFVNLSGARHAVIANAQGVGTIQDNAPTAVNDSNATDQYTPVNGNVLANDFAPTGDTMTVATVNGSAAKVGTPITLASGALLRVNADGSYTYTPNGAFSSLSPGQSATDTFTYSAVDARGLVTNAATVTITVRNDAPIAVNVYDSTDQFTPVYDNVLAYDIAPTGDTLSVTTVNGSAANVGKQITLASGALLTVNADGSFTYDPNGAFNYLSPDQQATDTFTYTAVDARGLVTNTATVTIFVGGQVSYVSYGGYVPDSGYAP